jgi:predicted dehydrogenase
VNPPPAEGAQKTEPRKPTGIAILGCGYWGINYVRVLSELPDAETIVVCDRRQARLEEVHKRFSQLKLTHDVEEAMRTPGVEAVIIATEAHTHYELAKKALLLDKHVLVEKPLTLEVGHADELVALAEERRRVLLVGHTFLYNAGIRRMKEYVTSKELGRVYYAYARRTSLGPIRHDVNAIWDLAAHDVAIFNYLLEAQPEWVSGVGAKVLRNSREDVGFISLGYPGGVVGHIHVSWADPNKVREVVIVGSDKRVVFNDLDPLERVRVFDKGVKSVHVDEPVGYGEFQFLMRDGDILSPALPVLEPLKHECGHFLHCLRRAEPPYTDALQGRAVVEVMEAIERSIAQSGAPVALKPSENGHRPGTNFETDLLGTVAASHTA